MQMPVLSQAELALLEQIKQNKDCSVYFALNNFSSALGVNDTQALLNRLQEAGLISVSGYRGDNLETRHIRLMPEGLHALMLEEECRQNRTAEEEKAKAAELQRIQERKQDRRHEWAIAIFSYLGGAVTALCVEHFEKILVFLGNLFH